MSIMITGILLKSYMAVARLMGSVEKRKSRAARIAIAGQLRAAGKKPNLKQA